MLQGLWIKNLHQALLHAQNAFVLKLGKGAADCFEFQPKVTADFLACHAQHQLGG